MAGVKSIPRTKKVDMDDKLTFDQPQDQWGEKLEMFFEENDVGMDGVIHWKDAAVEEIDLYNLMGWHELDNIRLASWNNVKENVAISPISYIKFEPFHYLLSSVYPGKGSFRYEEPKEGGSSETEMILVFSELTNLGVTGSLKF